MRSQHLLQLVLAALLSMVMLGVGTGCSDNDSLTVTKLSRSKGVEGDTLTIYGTGFQKGGSRSVRVFFDDTKAHVLGFKGNEQLSVKIPGGIEYGTTVDIKIVFEPGGVHTYKDAFTYVKPERASVDDLVGEEK
jgi:hypothetical protein